MKYIIAQLSVGAICVARLLPSPLPFNPATSIAVGGPVPIASVALERIAALYAIEKDMDSLRAIPPRSR
jgi:hypothetical protein